MGLEKLIGHPRIWRGRESHPQGRVLSTGFGRLDAILPGGGWPIETLTEIILESYGIGELSLLMPTLARLSQPERQEHAGGWIIWISPPFIPYAPALKNHGVDLNRVLLVHPSAHPPGGHRDGLWAMEQALRSGSCVAVLAWARVADEAALRRLQLAAEEGHCWAVLFRPTAVLRERSPAALRMRLSRQRMATRVEIVKCRGGRPGTFSIGDTGWW